MADRRNRTREVVILAAAYELADRGYYGTSYGRIAARAGVKRGLVQHYLRSKADIARTVAQRAFQDGVFMAQAAAGPQLRGVEAILRFTVGVASRFLHSPYARASARILEELAHDDIGLPTPFIGWMQRIEANIREAIKDGELPDSVDPVELAWLLVAAFHGVKSVTESLLDLDAFARRAGTIVAQLLAAHGARDAMATLATVRRSRERTDNGKAANQPGWH